jgi:hypothetical protein
MRIAAAVPEVLQGVAIGHARLSNALDGEHAPLNREVYAACSSLIQTDPGAFVHQFVRMTGGELMEGGYGEEIVKEYRRRVPSELMLPFWESRPEEGEDFADVLRGLRAPLLLAQHKGCLLYTDEGFDAVVAALPDAKVLRLGDKPSTSPEFADALRTFCAAHVTLSA